MSGFLTASVGKAQTTQNYVQPTQNYANLPKPTHDDTSPDSNRVVSKGVDLDKLAKAVARHETNGCTKGSAKYNNCFGIMEWPNGKRRFKRYATKEESYDHFKKIWAKSYGGMPTLAKAKKYSGNDKSTAWLNNVTKFYNAM